MGRIKTSHIKNVAIELVERYGDKFSTDFQKNKQILSELVTINSKKLRNVIAGYITTVMKRRG